MVIFNSYFDKNAFQHQVDAQRIIYRIESPFSLVNSQDFTVLPPASTLFKGPHRCPPHSEASGVSNFDPTNGIIMGLLDNDIMG